MLRRGEVSISFDTLEELASRLHQLATVIELPDFERRFCRHNHTPPAAEARQEMDELLADLEDLEASRPAIAGVARGLSAATL